MFGTAIVVCPDCGAENETSAVMSVNADRRPDLRQDILDGTFQEGRCRRCEALVRLQPQFVYLELRHGHWIVAKPAAEAEEWQAAEQAAGRTFEAAFGPDAPPAARGLADGLRPRLVFGWPALQEKLILVELGLDDTVLELLKIALMQTVQGLDLRDRAEFRLGAGNADTLAFHWLKPDTSEVLHGLTVPRKAYDDVAADPDPWSALRGRVQGRFYVDSKRAFAPAQAADIHAA